MGKGDYAELIFRLGELARERFGSRPYPPRSMQRVFKAEEAVLQQRQLISHLEQQLNAEEGALRQFLKSWEVESAKLKKVVSRHRPSIRAAEAHAREIDRRISALSEKISADRQDLKDQRLRHDEMASEGAQPTQVALSKEHLKLARLALTRKERERTALSEELERAVTPRPGQAGQEGLIALKRLLEIGSERDRREMEARERMAELEASMKLQAEELRGAEEYLQEALTMLGEDCYAERIADPVLSPFYPRLDKARG
jgi:hypothetical protein